MFYVGNGTIQGSLIVMGICLILMGIIFLYSYLSEKRKERKEVSKYNIEERAKVLPDSADKEFRDSLPPFLIYQTDRELEYARWISYLHCRLTQETALKDKEAERVAWLSGNNQEMVKEKEEYERKLEYYRELTKTLIHDKPEIKELHQTIADQIKEMGKIELTLPRDVLRDVSGAKGKPIGKRKRKGNKGARKRGIKRKSAKRSGK